ncbi:mechanosensitive ion channel family protein [Chryseobacterium caseinilyticum]|uniref:Mechanosensitive ion channel family protein n=1 Tax=Chryseobacterium caseinilyticum TaxID=2771428 RepID=A0ABR8ZGQ8_9FLAO|nr:mechanosensitive ion channel family protein [Chryseobacterium caseinilyticum]MBD8083983.1 mechanosensitive ion channel family protein [Chryseobacterium caseinilyticum]
MEINVQNYLATIYKVLENWYIAFARLTPKLIMGAIVFTFFLLTSKYLSKLAVKLFHKFFPKSTAEASVTTTVSVFRFLILVIGIFITLEIMGFSSFLWKFIGSLGVAGVIAGVALKDLVSSIFSGMLIGIDKAFKVGDYITIGNHSGTVLDIGLLTTKMTTDDGKKVFIPNQVIFNAPFYNITASPQRRIILNFEIPADEDINIAKAGILEIVQNIEELDRPENVDVVYTDLKQGAFNLQVRFWMKVGSNMLLVKNEVLTKIKDRFDADGVQLVTPTSIQISNPNPLVPSGSDES